MVLALACWATAAESSCRSCDVRATSSLRLWFSRLSCADGNKVGSRGHDTICQATVKETTWPCELHEAALRYEGYCAAAPGDLARFMELRGAQLMNGGGTRCAPRSHAAFPCGITEAMWSVERGIEQGKQTALGAQVVDRG